MLDKAKIDEFVIHCQGWCGSGMANLMANRVYDAKIKLSVEIGVWNGQSFFPVAYAHKMRNIDGVHYGIDPLIPYKVPGLGEITKDSYDLEGMYAALLSKLKFWELEKYGKIIRQKSEDVVTMFQDGTIDFLYIDGDHSPDAVMKDIKLYYPKVRKGSIIWFDDGNKPGVIPAIEYAKTICTLKEQIGALKNNFIFQK
jgi:hypothetical protein